MKQQTQNTFANGMIKDLNPLSTPKDVLTDCLNGTVITYNGDEFVLQNDMGNCKVDSAHLSPGFIPLGMKEYGGIVYVASLNPETRECEIGSFPAPQQDFSTTDYNNIGPATFTTADFIVNTGNDSVKEKTDKTLKLFEPELLQLHPGDLYVVTYKINDPNPPANPSDPDKIDSDSKYENFITQDPTDRKLFRLTFSKISDSNNLLPLTGGDIKVIPWQADVEEELVYYKESSQATLAISLEMEQLDMFEASVVDASLNTSSNKKVAISAIGEGDSLASFEGVRVHVTSPVDETFFLEKQGSNKKVAAILDDLAANDNFQCAITPYSPYSLYPKLTKNFNLTLGKYLSAGSGINNIFTYYKDSTFMKIDFDYRFQGNNPDGIHLYVEFYDPWSDYSIVKTVDNPTYYGINTVIMELVDEPRSTVFDSFTAGGTPRSKLITNSDTDFESTLLNSTNLIRKDQFLRKDHFYIVRISGVDKTYDADTQTYSYQHYDLYKGMYTTSMFNSIYTNQASLSVNDPSYVADFNSLDFKLEAINYETEVKPVLTNNAVPILENYPNVSTTDPDTGIVTKTYPLMTNQNYYKVRETAYTDPLTYRASTTYRTDSIYDLSLTLKGTNQVFGDFDTSLITAEFPTLLPSDSGSSGVKPTIVEQVVPNTPDTNSVATWSATSLGNGKYKITLSLKTDRSVEGPGMRDPLNTTGQIYKLVSIEKSFHYMRTGSSGLRNSKATLEMGAYQSYNPDQGPAYLAWIDEAGTYHYSNLGSFANAAPDGPHVFSLFNSPTKKFSAVWGGAGRRANTLHWQGAPAPFGGVTNDSYDIKTHMLYFRNENNGSYMACRTTDLNVAIDFFNKIKVASNVSKTLYLYYPDESQLTFNGQLTTTAQFTGADITTKFEPNGSPGSYSKTYLSTFMFKALDSVETFQPTVLNDYIAARKGSSVILDGKDTIRDGFIPYIQDLQTSTYTMVFNDISISQAANSNALTQMKNGSVDGPQDTAFVISPNAKPHGTVTLEEDSTQYNKFLANFSSGNVVTGQEVNPETVYIHVSATAGIWQGGWWENGKDRWGGAPAMFQDLQIT